MPSMAKMNPPLRGLAGPGSAPAATPRVGWSPTVDGRIVTARSFYDVAAGDLQERTHADRLGERRRYALQSPIPLKPSGTPLSPRHLGEAKAGALIAAMKKAHPEKSIRTSVLWRFSGMTARNNVQRMVKLKYEQGGAPVYPYYFTWQSPMLEELPARGTRPSCLLLR